MSIVANCCSWMSHLAPIVVNSNDYYFMKNMHILKPQSYTHKLQKLFLVLNCRNSKMASMVILALNAAISAPGMVILVLGMAISAPGMVIFALANIIQRFKKN